jgi:putative peptide zinc metalloprotease protein
MASELGPTIDPTPSRPTHVALDPQVVFTRREIGGRSHFVAQHPATGKFYQLGQDEYRVASLLDGQRTVTEILSLLARDRITWDAHEVAQFVARLVANGLASQLHHAPAPAPAIAPAPAGLAWARRLPQLLSLLLSQRFPLLNGDRIAAWLARRLGFVFSPVGTVYWCGWVISGLMIVAAHRQNFHVELQRMFDPGVWLVLLIFWAMAKVVHEVGHATAARYHGVQVGKIGIMLFFFAPLAYVDVTDSWKLKNRWSRVQIALAGVYLELAVSALAAWAWWLLPDGLPRHLAAQLFLVTGPATLLVNANPLLRLDGYYVVSDLSGIPNLRMHGRMQLVGLLEKLLIKIEPPQPLLSGWPRHFATAHAVCSVAFQVVWMSGLIVGVSMWAKGLGLLLAAIAVVLWLVLPLARWVHKIWMIEPPAPPRSVDSRRASRWGLERWGLERWGLGVYRRRLLWHAMLLALLIEYLAASSSPLARRVPVVVQFRGPQVARASADALVHSVYVVHGQYVNQGMILLELVEPELLIRRNKMSDELQLAELRAIQFRRQGDLAKSASEAEHAESLRRQLAELDEQIKGLSVSAERDGLVLSPRFDSLLGRFVRRGEELLQVSDPQEKELLASIGQADVQAYQAAVARAQPAPVRLRGGITLHAIPVALRPRAQSHLPHPALSATAGGPLAVEPSPDAEGEVRVIEPRLEAITPLDPPTSIELQAGQIGTMILDDNQSLLARVWDRLTR